MTTDLIYNINAIINILKFNSNLINKIYIYKINKKILNIINYSKYLNIKLFYINFINNKNLKYIIKNFYIIMQIKIINNKFTITNSILQNNFNGLILDRIQDPHNLASCIRTCEAFNITFLILSKKNTVKINTLINNISHATSLFLPILIVNNLKNIINYIINKKIKIIGFSSRSNQLIHHINLKTPVVIIMGSEKNGIRKYIINKCDHVYKIPMLGKCDNINLSVATGIILYCLN